MRIVVVVAAILFCMPVFAQNVKPKSVTNTIGMELIEIPAGKFTMGSPEREKDRGESEAQVRVTLTKPFELGKTEVTQGQWKSVMGTEPWKRQPYTIKGENVVATYVDYNDAADFCERLTDLERNAGKLKADEEYRLPTEAEWEYACRAGTTTAYSFGDDESKLGEYAWSDGNAYLVGEAYAHKVGLKKPNPWGLHDMHGNVAEWCSDWYDKKLSGGVDPVGPVARPQGMFEATRVNRGGGWRSRPGGGRSAFRDGSAPSNRNSGLGFRVARSQLETVVVADRRQQGAQAEPAPQVTVEKRPVITITNSIGMELIGIPAGTFTMGDVAVVAVTLTKPFELGKYEVTQGQWKSVMGTEPWNRKSFVRADKDYPATYVNWDDATDFCKKLTEIERKAGTLKANEKYRLPTEAEWEYACRAGTTTAFSFGDDEEQLGNYGWFSRNKTGEGYAHKVGMKDPNPWGLHDMHGNVWEWCSDWFATKLAGGTDPIGPNGGLNRVSRGSCWGDRQDACRSASRLNNPSDRDFILGFRVARSQSAP